MIRAYLYSFFFFMNFRLSPSKTSHFSVNHVFLVDSFWFLYKALRKTVPLCLIESDIHKIDYFISFYKYFNRSIRWTTHYKTRTSTNLEKRRAWLAARRSHKPKQFRKAASQVPIPLTRPKVCLRSKVGTKRLTTKIGRSFNEMLETEITLWQIGNE